MGVGVKPTPSQQQEELTVTSGEQVQDIGVVKTYCGVISSLLGCFCGCHHHVFKPLYTFAIKYLPSFRAPQDHRESCKPMAIFRLPGKDYQGIIETLQKSLGKAYRLTVSNKCWAWRLGALLVLFKNVLPLQGSNLMEEMLFLKFT